MKLAFLAMMLVSIAVAQEPAKTPTPAEIENKELMQALSEAGTSPVDLTRTIEAFLEKHPQNAQRKQLELVLARAAIDNKDDRRIILYGERVLAATPDDMLILDRVAKALLAAAGRENAEKSLKYSRAFEQNIRKAEPPVGREAGRRQDDRERGLGRALLYESRAQTILGEKPEAERLRLVKRSRLFPVKRVRVRGPKRSSISEKKTTRCCVWPMLSRFPIRTRPSPIARRTGANWAKCTARFIIMKRVWAI